MLTGLPFPWLALMLLAGVLLDLLLGEPSRWHPLVGFGRCASFLERRLNRGTLAGGAAAWAIAVLPVPVLVYCALRHAAFGWPIALLHIGSLYFCLGLRSLRDHNLPIQDALSREDLAQARALTSCIVSRDTRQALSADLAKASTESLLENGNDAVFASLFWFVVAGAAGVLLYRFANTLDAMWGYRNARFNLFGRTAARIDDVMNWAPARLTALTYVLLASGLTLKRRAWQCWHSQAPEWSSPNAGPVMASGAGALGLALGGAAIYEGVLEQRPVLGAGRAAQGSDIGRAWRLVAAGTALWVGMALCAGMLVFLIGR